jgi:flavin-dependent dehydrogenase
MQDNQDYDVVVVGARCGGAPSAMLLARQGHRVLLLDRAPFPSDTLSTLYIQQPGVALLDEWGLLAKVRDSGCPTIDEVVYRLGDVSVSGCATPVRGIRGAYAPLRIILDQILVDGAIAAGVEFADRTRVTALRRDGAGRVTGVVCRTGPDGPEVTVRCALLVGADGMRSTVADLVGAPKVVEHPKLTCAYYALWEGVPSAFEMYEGDTGWIAAVPTNDATLVAAYHPQDRFDEVRHRAREAYLTAVRDNALGLHERLRAGRQSGALHGTGDQQNYFRQAGGPGWALVGDAGHHKDSLTARGIGDAFLQARLLAEHAGPHLGDGADPAALDAAVAGYGAARDAALTEAYQGTIMLAQVAAREQRRALLRVISQDAALTQQYFDTVAGLRRPAELYTPALLSKLQAT